jgi:hypothetical protein
MAEFERQRCRWCGRFFASPNPYAEACVHHLAEEREANRIDMERYNARIAARKAQEGAPKP